VTDPAVVWAGELADASTRWRRRPDHSQSYQHLVSTKPRSGRPGQCGRAHTFAIAVIVVLVWAVTGPLFQFSDTWQLVINIGATIERELTGIAPADRDNPDTPP
jgi:Low affinity iron permease